MSFGLIVDSCFRDHATGRHPERPERLDSIDSAFKEHKILESCHCLSFEPAEEEFLEKVHRKEMIERAFATSAKGGGFLDPDTILSGYSARVATQAAGASIALARAAVQGEFRRGFAVVRPPGHHATHQRSMGFCIFNNIALAAEAMLELDSIRKVAIVDFDVHHGNGTQDIFYERGDVFFLSLHEYPHYPGTGQTEETGAGEGQGTTLNVPLPPGIDQETWFEAFHKGLEAISQYNPDAILVSAGFDSHRRDPLGDFPLDEKAYARIGGLLADLAGEHPLISILEGGYNVDVLGSSVVAYIDGLRGR